MNMFSHSEDMEDPRDWMGRSIDRENHCLKLAILLISLIIMTAAPGIVLLIIEEAKLTSKSTNPHLRSIFDFPNQRKKTSARQKPSNVCKT